MSNTIKGINIINHKYRSDIELTSGRLDSIIPIPIRGKTIKTNPKLIAPITRIFLPFKVLTGLIMKYEYKNNAIAKKRRPKNK